MRSQLLHVGVPRSVPGTVLTLIVLLLVLMVIFALSMEDAGMGA